MKNFKNYVITLLAGLLVLSLSTQQAQSAGTSKEAKIAQYTICLQAYGPTSPLEVEIAIQSCARYRP
jgi:hypothetical protein